MSKHSHHMTGALLGELKLCTEVGPSLGDTRIHLLEAIDRLGSLTQAAKSIPLSYRAAWDALDEMNNLAEQPLVVRTTGGKNGGGTLLTAYGKQTDAEERTETVPINIHISTLIRNVQTAHGAVPLHRHSPLACYPDMIIFYEPPPTYGH